MVEAQVHRSKWCHRTALTIFMEAPSSSTTVQSSMLLINIQTTLDADAPKESSASFVSSGAAWVAHFIYRASVKVDQPFTVAGIGPSSFSLMKACGKVQL